MYMNLIYPTISQLFSFITFFFFLFMEFPGF